MFTASTLATSLTIPHPRELAGEWILSDAQRFCGIHLWIDEIPQANGFRLTVDAHAGACNFPMDAVAWRSAPDGIALLDQEGGTLIFLSQEVGGYRSDITSDRGLRLQRKPAGN